MDQHYSTLFEAHAKTLGEATAIRQGGRSTSWRAFDERAGRFASALRSAGLGRGSRVGQLMFNSPALLETFHGALKLRAVPFNINYRYTAEEILYILADAEAEALVFHTSLSSAIAEVLPKLPRLRLAVGVDDGPPVPPGALAYDDILRTYEPANPIPRDPADPVMVYTGGTTGMPKGVLAPMGPHIHHVLQAMPGFFDLPPISDPAEAVPLAARLRREGRPYVGLPLPPMVHGAALNIMALPTLIIGGTVVLATRSHFEPDATWDLVEAEGVNAMLIVGDAFARPLALALRQGRGRDLSSLRLISSAGAALSGGLKTELLSFMRDDAAILEFIASTEAPMGSSLTTRGQSVETGRFTPAPGVLVLDEDDLPLAPGSPIPGRIAVPTASYGYLNDDAKTAATFPVIDGQRYAIPGDFALLDADGSIRLLGRGSTCINSGGLKVFPEEVEDALKAHPSVSDAVVIGRPDDRFGESVAAILSLQDGSASLDGILEGLRHRLAGYKIPRAVRVVAEVPRNNVGKPDYAAIQHLFAPDLKASP